MVRVLTAMVACMFMLTLAHNAVYAQDGRIRFKIKLHTPTKVDAPKGKAKYDERASGRKKLNVEVEHIVGTTNIEVKVEGALVGSAALTLGTVEIELDTKKGDTVPTMTESSLVEVFDADTDILILTSA
jgi:hypothetical protein